MALPQLTDTLRENLGDLIPTAVNCEHDDSLAALTAKLDAHHAEIIRKRQARRRAKPAPATVAKVGGGAAAAQGQS